MQPMSSSTNASSVSAGTAAHKDGMQFSSPATEGDFGDDEFDFTKEKKQAPELAALDARGDRRGGDRGRGRGAGGRGAGSRGNSRGRGGRGGGATAGRQQPEYHTDIPESYIAIKGNMTDHLMGKNKCEEMPKGAIICLDPIETDDGKFAGEIYTAAQYFAKWLNGEGSWVRNISPDDLKGKDYIPHCRNGIVCPDNFFNVTCCNPHYASESAVHNLLGQLYTIVAVSARDEAKSMNPFTLSARAETAKTPGYAHFHKGSEYYKFTFAAKPKDTLAAKSTVKYFKTDIPRFFMGIGRLKGITARRPHQQRGIPMEKCGEFLCYKTLHHRSTDVCRKFHTNECTILTTLAIIMLDYKVEVLKPEPAARAVPRQIALPPRVDPAREQKSAAVAAAVASSGVESKNQFSLLMEHSEAERLKAEAPKSTPVKLAAEPAATVSSPKASPAPAPAAATAASPKAAASPAAAEASPKSTPPKSASKSSAFDD